MKTIVFNDWEISDKISVGSFSTVYKAIGPNDCLSAIKYVSFPRDKKELDKIINMGLAKDYNGANNYFMRIVNNEVVIMKKFNGSPNIVNCFDASIDNKDDGSGFDYYIRMEYIEDIKSYYSKGLIDVDEVVKLGIDICSALELCLSINLTHCDIKPENIFVGNDGNYKLGDFSSAFFNNGGNNNYYGSLNYVAPEIYNGKGVSKNTDLYSLGLVMYQLLSGNLPFMSNCVDEKAAFNVRMSGKEIPLIRGVNKKLMDIIVKACSFDEKNRYNTPTDMKNDLKGLSHITSRKMKVVFSSNNIFEGTVDINDPNLLSASSNIKDNSRLRFRDKYNIRAIIAGLILISLISVLGTTYALNRGCESGYVNKNGFCVAGYYYCEQGYSLNENNKCQKTIESKEAKVTYTCPSGYALNGDYCVSTDVKEPQFVYKCADGFKLKGTKCEKTESVDAVVTYSCPSDYVPVGSKCFTITNIDATLNYVCADSTYTLSGTTCSKTITMTKNADLSYVCGSNEEYNENLNKCIYSVDANKAIWGRYYYCSNSNNLIELKDGKCYYGKSPSLSYKCTEGEYVGDGKCKYTTKDKKDAIEKYVCPSGYVSKGRQCVKDAEIAGTPKYTCTDSMTLKGKKCYATITSDAVGMYECPDGFIVSGLTCIQNDLPTPIKKYSCSKVYTLNGGMCEKYEIVNSKVYYLDK